MIDFARLNARLLPNLRQHAQEWLPGGKFEGREYVVRNPRRADSAAGSFKINVTKGVWRDFASEDAGADPVSLYAFCTGQSQAEAARDLIDRYGIADALTDQPAKRQPAKQAEWTPVMPVPAGAPDCNRFGHSRFGQPTAVWTYRDQQGYLLMHVARYDPPGDKKQFVPFTFCTDGARTDWRMKSPATRPLYNLDMLAANPTAPVLFVEGEKAADYANTICGRFVAITAAGGSAIMPADIDLEPLRGRRVAIFPDNDRPGLKAAYLRWQALQGIAASVTVVRCPPDKPKGWDVADATDWAEDDLYQWVRGNCYQPTEAEIEDVLKPDAPAAPANDNTPAADDWPEPVDVFAGWATPALRPELLPAGIGDFVFDQAELVGTDPAILGLACIVTAAACIHDGIRLQPKRHDPTWTESARLWGAVVGDPSVRKSPAISKATSHIKKIDKQEVTTSNEELAAYELEAKVYKAAEKKYVAAQAKDDPTVEKPHAPERPKQRRAVVYDTTVEQMSEILKDNERGVLTLVDELSGWFGAMDAYKAGGGVASKDRSYWLEAYNGGPKTIDRVNRGTVIVPNWSACILGGIQPEPMQRIATKLGDDGLLQRFMVVIAKGGQQSVDRVPNMDALNDWRSLLDDLWATKPSEGAVITLAPAAHEQRERIDALAATVQAAGFSPQLTSHLGKWSGLFARLLVVYHAIECRRARTHPTEAQVTGATAKRVADFMAEFLLPHALTFYCDVLMQSRAIDNLRRAAEQILVQDMAEFKRQALTKNVRNFRSMDDWEWFAIVNNLEASGWMVPVDEKQRPCKLWRVNPHVHTMYAHTAAKLKRRRDDSGKILRQVFAGGAAG